MELDHSGGGSGSGGYDGVLVVVGGNIRSRRVWRLFVAGAV